MQQVRNITQSMATPQPINVGHDERMASLALGALLALVTLGKSWRSLLTLGVGGYLIYRGVSGHCFVYDRMQMDTADEEEGGEPVTRPVERGVHVERSVTVNRPPAEVYLFWRNLENLPTFMHHLQSVTAQGPTRSHWVAKAPIGGVPVEWDAEIIEERASDLISWGSLPGGSVKNAGQVHFRPAPGGRGTEVHVELEYTPPGGTVGEAVSRLFNKATAQQIKDDLRRFKEVMEAGETPTVEGQPSGRSRGDEGTKAGAGQPTGHPGGRTHPDVIGLSSEDSFPASDPPGYAGGTAG